MLKRLGIKPKVYLLTGLFLIISAVSALFSSQQVQNIGSRIFQISQISLPLSNEVTLMTVIQMQQSIYLERSMRIGEQLLSSRNNLTDFADQLNTRQVSSELRKELATSQEKLAAFQVVKKKFMTTSTILINDIAVAKRMLKSRLARTKNTKEKALFQVLYDDFLKLEKKYRSFVKDTNSNVFNAIELGNMTLASEKMNQLVIEKTAIDTMNRSMLAKLAGFTTATVSSATTQERFAGLFIMVIAIGGLLASGALAVIIAHGITGPIKTMTAAMSDISQGNLEQTIPAQDHKGELGEMAHALKIFHDNMFEIKRLEAELRLLATTDPLTGISNRRHFLHKAEEEIVRARRYKKPLGFLMIDLDKFKCVNDTYGHPCGDEVLRRFVATTQKFLRVTDVFGRYGGEEFTVLLPETDTQGAIAVAERIRYGVENMTIQWNDETLHITISIGLGKLSPDDTSIHDVITRADKALYIAKSKGRNQIIVNDANATMPAQNAMDLLGLTNTETGSHGAN